MLSNLQNVFHYNNKIDYNSKVNFGKSKKVFYTDSLNSEQIRRVDDENNRKTNLTSLVSARAKSKAVKIKANNIQKSTYPIIRCALRHQEGEFEFNHKKGQLLVNRIHLPYEDYNIKPGYDYEYIINYGDTHIVKNTDKYTTVVYKGYKYDRNTHLMTADEVYEYGMNCKLYSYTSNLKKDLNSAQAKEFFEYDIDEKLCAYYKDYKMNQDGEQCSEKIYMPTTTSFIPFA